MGGLYAQTIMPAPLVDAVCSNIPVSVPFTVQGRFGTDNAFQVQLRNAYTGEVVYTSPAGAGSPLAVSLPAGLPAFTDPNRYQYRIVSTSPAIQSDWTRLGGIQTPASVTLAGGPGTIVNPAQPYELRYTVQGSSPISLTLSDGTQQVLDGGGSYAFEQRATINPLSSGTFSIRSVQNACGAGQSTGAVSLTINAIALKTVSAAPATVCSGGTIVVAYAKAGGTFGPANTFKIRLTTYNPFTGSPSAADRQYDLEATPVEGGLRAVIPASVSTADPATYLVQVISSDPVAISDPVSSNSLRVFPAITAQLIAPAVTAVDAGEMVPLRVLLNGRGPGEVRINDSLSVAIADFGTSTNETTLWLKPRRTTTFRITSVQSVCGTQSVTAASGVTISVRAGVVIDSLPGSTFLRGPVCEGQSITLPVRLNFTPTADTQTFVEFRYGTSGSVVAIAPAVIRDGTRLVLTVPTLPSDTANFFGRRQYGLRVLTVDPATESTLNLDQVLVVSARPRPVVAPPDRALTLASPGNALVRVQRLGGGPYELKLSNGQVITNNCLDCDDANLTIYAGQTKSVRILYAQNTCGRVDNPPASTTLTVQNLPAAQIEIDSVEQNRCNTDSIRVYFRTIGDVAPSLTVQATSAGFGVGEGWVGAAIVGRGSRNPIQIKLDEVSKIRLQAGTLVSNEVRVDVNKKPAGEINYVVPATNSLFGAEPSSIRPGTAVALDLVYVTGQGPFRTVYTDGTTDFTAPNGGTRVVVTPTTRTTYRLKSISNACGAGTVTAKTATYTPMPFDIRVPTALSDTYYYRLCSGTAQRIPFITSPAAPAGTVYALQLATRRDSVFADLATTESSPFTVTLPASLTTGDYYLRIVAKNTDARSAALLTSIQQPPTATLTGTVPAAVDAGAPVSLSIALTGAAPWQVLYNDLQGQTITAVPATREVRPAATQTFSIRSVSNACGYGTASGEVTIRVKPQLSVVMNSVAGQFICAGSTLPASLSAAGDFATGATVRYALSPVGGTTDIALGSGPTQTGAVGLTLPATVPAGTYRLRATVGDGLAEALGTAFEVGTKPLYTLSGSVTVNAGQTTYLTLKGAAGNGNQPVSYILSDGYQGSFISAIGQVPLRVDPLQTTTYTIRSIQNSCGAGTATGTATVTVLPAADRSIEIVGLGDGFTCAGSRVTVRTRLRGVFSLTNVFTVQLSDSTGSTFRDVPTSGVDSLLQVTLPTDLPTGYGYRFRVTSTDGVVSGSSSLPYTFRSVATVSFTAATYTLLPGTPLRAGVTLTGTGPWFYTIQNAGKSLNYQTSTPTATIDLPLSNDPVYRLTAISNGCGTGQVVGNGSTQVLLVTATEPAAPASALSVYPNPATDRVWVDLTALTGKATLQLFDLRGQLLSEQTATGGVADVWLNKWSEQVFLLRVTEPRSGFRATYRILRAGL
ncbi:hypothetical protein GCM10027578_42220 [Spirosoma luteolum]